VIAHYANYYPEASVGRIAPADIHELDAKTMEKAYTPEDVIRRIESELAAGKKIRAKTIICQTTNMGIKETREIVEGRRKIRPEEVTSTDLDNLNKAGCGVGSAALVVGLSFVAYLLT
jgi:ribosomal protein L7/L12